MLGHFKLEEGATSEKVVCSHHGELSGSIGIEEGHARTMLRSRFTFVSEAVKAVSTTGYPSLAPG